MYIISEVSTEQVLIPAYLGGQFASPEHTEICMTLHNQFVGTSTEMHKFIDLVDQRFTPNFEKISNLKHCDTRSPQPSLQPT